ncbi:hypothetical protein D3C73_1366660 [compost metagenome]
MAGVPGHEEADAEEHHGQPLGRLGQEVGRATRTEHGPRGASAKARTCRRTRATLHQDQRDHGYGNQHVDDIEDQHQHWKSALGLECRRLAGNRN